MTPVVTQLIPVAGHYPDAVAFNREVSAFNRGIDSTFRGMDGVRILDLNPELAPTGVLESRFAQEDGIHLTPAAYRIWGRRIREVLSEAGI